MSSRTVTKKRAFDSDKGDRVARDPDDNTKPASNFGDAIEYAAARAMRLERRQELRIRKRRSGNNWYLVFNTNRPLVEDQ